MKGHWARDCSKAPSRDRRDGERGYDRDRRYDFICTKSFSVYVCVPYHNMMIDLYYYFF